MCALLVEHLETKNASNSYDDKKRWEKTMRKNGSNYNDKLADWLQETQTGGYDGIIVSGGRWGCLNVEQRLRTPNEDTFEQQ